MGNSPLVPSAGRGREHAPPAKFPVHHRDRITSSRTGPLSSSPSPVGLAGVLSSLPSSHPREGPDEELRSPACASEEGPGEELRKLEGPDEDPVASPASHRRKSKLAVKKKPQLKLAVKKKLEKKHLQPRPLDLEDLVAYMEKLFLEKLKEKEEEEKRQEFKKSNWWLFDGDTRLPSMSPAEVAKRWPLPDKPYEHLVKVTNCTAGSNCSENIPLDEFLKREVGYNPDDYYHPPPPFYYFGMLGGSGEGGCC